MRTVTLSIAGSPDTVTNIGSTLSAADQTALIQSALDAAAAAGGGRVTLSAGTFDIIGTGTASDGALRIGSDTDFEGAGQGSTILRLADGSGSVTGIVRTDSGQALPDGSFATTSNVTISGLTIDGNSANTSGDVDGIYTGSRPDSGFEDSNITIEDVEIHSVSRYGFDPHEGTTNLTIRDAVAHNNGRDGFTIDGSSNVLIENVTAYDNGRHGLNVVTGSSNVTITGANSYDNASSGLAIQTGDNEVRAWTQDITVSNSTFDNNARYGIEAKQASDVTLTNLTVTDNGFYGVLLSGVRDAELTSVTMTGNNNGGGQYDLRTFVQDFDDTPVENDRAIATEGVVVDGVAQAATALPGSPAEYDWVISSGDDTILGSTVADRISAGKGDDTIDGGDGDDRLAGNAGDDVLNGGAGDDELFGNKGNDTAVVSAGFDSFDGGFGFDTVDLTGMTSAAYVDLKTNGHEVRTSGTTTVTKSTATIDVMSLDNVEEVIGSGFNDRLLGSNASDLISGSDGDDIVRGRSGSDTLYGDAGKDQMWGDGASDLLDGGAGDDKLDGNAGNDTLIGGDGDDRLTGGTGSDVFVFGENWGEDRIVDFGNGGDKMDFSSVAGVQSMSDLSITAQGSDVIVAYGGNEIELDNVAITDIASNDFIF